MTGTSHLTTRITITGHPRTLRVVGPLVQGQAYDRLDGDDRVAAGNTGPGRHAVSTARRLLASEPKYVPELGARQQPAAEPSAGRAGMGVWGSGC
jgi:hypothetical protein